MIFMEFPTVWSENSPLSLVDIAIKSYISNVHALYEKRHDHRFKLKHDVSLPREICDRIIHIAKTELDHGVHQKPLESNILHAIIELFQDPLETRISRVDFSNSNITDEDLEIISRHCITELNISNCSMLTRSSFEYLNRVKSSLLSLNVGHCNNILPHIGFSTDEDGIISIYDDCIDFKPDMKNSILHTLNVRRLVVEGLDMSNTYQFLFCSLKQMSLLTHLDLSRCKDVSNFKFMQHHKHLRSLILFNVPGLENCFDAIRTISKLRHLDVSQPSELHFYYRNPNKILKSIMTSLVELVSLDISGTNLAGDRVQERDEEILDNVKYPSIASLRAKENPSSEEDSVTDIAGLKNRVHRPLDFLGLYNTAHEACYRHHIPAKMIAGDANEEQILTAGRAYCSRPEVIQKVLNDLFHIFRFSSCNDTKLALDVVMEAMRQHIKTKHIQISGSASLFYIVKGEEKINFNIKIKKKIIKTLLDAMLEHSSDVTMIRNGCLTLIHFKIPEDVFFDYERLVNLLLVIITQDDQDEFVQRISVYLLNSIACQVDGKHKQLIGDRGAITTMLSLISGRLSQQVCDEVMETAWSTMWNVTDETPVNSQRFLDNNGMFLFLECLKTFPEKPELLRNMMGLLGNVAEVKELRSSLMADGYILKFCDLLSSNCDGIEVSYNAVGILSHITSDGPDTWKQHNISVSMDHVLTRMVLAIDSWNLNAKRNINYRSFEPILRLLYVDEVPEAQYWAIWALANLTRVYPDKYCPLLKEEKGLEIIERHSKNVQNKKIQELAQMILLHCEGYTAGKRDNEDDDSALLL